MKKRKNMIAAIISLSLCVMLLLLILYSNGWFYGSGNKSADTDAMEVDMPPILYILDSDAEDMTQLSLSGLEIGVEKQIVFCISSVYPINAERSLQSDKLAFDLELVYTNNLGATFNLYSADIIPPEDASSVDAFSYLSQKDTQGYFKRGKLLTYENQSEAGNQTAYAATDYSAVQEKNQSTYKIFKTTPTITEPNFALRFQQNDDTIHGDLFNTLKCRFFILDITWDDASVIDPKETDLVYIIARGQSTEGGS